MSSALRSEYPGIRCCGTPNRKHRRSLYWMRTPTRGRLLHSSAAPMSGEHMGEAIHIGGVAIEQILSVEVDKPVDYDQDQDEWVVLLEGTAELEMNGERVL